MVMAPWRGWDEAEVRGEPCASTPSIAVSGPTGFIPVNAPLKRGSSTSDSHQRSKHPEHDEQAAPIDHARSVASAYLGRGMDPKSAELTAAQNARSRGGRGTRKTATAGRKRKAKPTESPPSKRRRTSSVKESMPTTKSSKVNNVTNSKTLPVQQLESAENARETTAPPSDVPLKPALSMNTPTAARPVSVFAPVTTMSALDSTSVRTSVEAVKASSGHGYVLYQGAVSTFSSSNGSQSKQSLTTSQRVVAAGERPSPISQSKASGHAMSTDVSDAQQSPRYQSKSRKPHTDIETRDSPRRRTSGDISRATVTHHEEDDTSRTLRRSARLNENGGNDCIVPEGPEDENSVIAGSEEDEFGIEGSEDEDLVNFTKTVEEAIDAETPSTRSRKMNTREVDEHENYGGALLTAGEKKALAKLKSAMKSGLVPIVRKPFPASVLDRSPIFGVSSAAVLRTCFRVGEALNTGSQAARTQSNVIIELYARVVASWREPNSRRQHFVFHDLYHDKPPHLKGTFELWEQSVIWDLDSKAFLATKKEGVMCRVIARMKRDGQTWRLVMMSIWEATWEDVNYVAGIYSGDIETV